MSGENPALLAAKLRSFGRTIFGRDVQTEDPDAGGGRGLVVDGRAMYLAPGPSGPKDATDGGTRNLGPALHWSAARQASALHLIAEGDVTADLARRAGLLTTDGLTADGPGMPVTVWRADGAELTEVSARPIEPPPELPAEHWALAGVITESGARAVDDHGMIVAEVAGLEVARIVDTDDGIRLDVGVGQADRELQQYIHGHMDDDANLRRAIGAVVTHRRPGAGGAHPLTRLARERWLRSVLLDEPGLIDAAELHPAVPLRARSTVLGGVPSAASGTTIAGSPVVVVCSVGVDLDLIPEAADYRARIDPQAELVLVLPERDRRLATASVVRLLDNTRVASIPEPWAPR